MEEIKQGYKQTDIGVIPEDWEVKPIGEVLKITTGNRNTQDKKDDGLYPFFVRSQIVERINSYSFDGEAVLTAGDGVGTGKVFHYINGKFDYHQRVYLVHGFDDKIIGKYFYWFFSKHFFERINQLTAKSSVDSVRREMIANMLVTLPKKEEQTAIATALSDTDALIAALDKKIAKKQQIKQGAMQQLLTGKKRLRGFSGEWVEKNVGSICLVKRGQMIVSSQFVIGKVPVIAGGMTPAGYHNVSNRSGNTITISASGANAGYVGFHCQPIFASDCSTINENEKFDIHFMYYTLKLKQEEIYKCQTGGAQPHIHPKDIEPFVIDFPTDKSEQTAIAQILTDMDNEIAQLEKERDKYKEIKAGMMQVLLTGRVRLV